VYSKLNVYNIRDTIFRLSIIYATINVYVLSNCNGSGDNVRVIKNPKTVSECNDKCRLGWWIRGVRGDVAIAVLVMVMDGRPLSSQFCCDFASHFKLKGSKRYSLQQSQAGHVIVTIAPEIGTSTIVIFSCSTFAPPCSDQKKTPPKEMSPWCGNLR